MRNPKTAPRLALVVGIVAVSSGSLFIRLAQVDVPSLVVAAYRLGAAALILFPIAWLRHRRELMALKPAECGWLIASGLFLALHFAAWITSLEYTSVAGSVTLVSTSPVWVALVAWFIWREPLTLRLTAGIGLALAGIIAIGFAEAGAAGSSKPFLGGALALAGALAISGYWLIGRRMRRHLSLVVYAAVVYGSAALFLITAALSLRQPLTGFKPATYVWLLLLALLPQLLGHSCFNWALGRLPAAYVAVATLGEPIGATILAFLFLGERPTLLKAAAVVLILAGIGIAMTAHQGTNRP